MENSTAPPDSRDTDDKAVTGSAERTLKLLGLLAAEGRPLSLAELTHELGLPKGTVHRLCANLVASRHLLRDVDERSFVVGPELQRLAFNTLNHASLTGARHGVLKDLVHDIGETCNLTTLDGTEVLYLDRVEARRPLRLTIDVGEHVPLHCTASGKLFLAYLPRRQRDAMIGRLALPALTPATLTDAASLRAECDEIVQIGFARDREEFVAGLIALAVPVRDGDGAVRAGISVHAPTARLSLSDAEARIDHLRRAAARMSRLL